MKSTKYFVAALATICAPAALAQGTLTNGFVNAMSAISSCDLSAVGVDFGTVSAGVQALARPGVLANKAGIPAGRSQASNPFLNKDGATEALTYDAAVTTGSLDRKTEDGVTLSVAGTPIDLSAVTALVPAAGIIAICTAGTSIANLNVTTHAGTNDPISAQTTTDLTGATHTVSSSMSAYNSDGSVNAGVATPATYNVAFTGVALPAALATVVSARIYTAIGSLDAQTIAVGDYGEVWRVDLVY